MADRFSYGGQAVLEGVLIRGRSCVSLAVRRPDGGIHTTYLPVSPIYSGPLRRFPLVRGVVVLLETLVVGFRALNYSAQIALGEEDKGKAPGRGAMAGGMVLALALGIGLFFLLPLLATRSLDAVIASSLVSNLLEGLLRLAILVGYIWGVGRISDIQRVFGYHGAEHMAVHAYEHGDPLEVERLARYPTAHPRCGTAFLLLVAVVSIVVFALLGRPALWLSVLSRVALVPPIAAVSYEFLRLAGAHSGNPLVRLLMSPGLALQSLTTRQPDAGQMEVAALAMQRALAADEGTGDAPGRLIPPAQGRESMGAGREGEAG
ncbi:MAG: DUF1385 domain-containing protein [Chloroflexi bacterium]|nr:DUF1385 domain-containing protein [Chloroflexota bacterium]